MIEPNTIPLLAAAVLSLYRQHLQSERWQRLAAAGAQPQRPASNGSEGGEQSPDATSGAAAGGRIAGVYDSSSDPR